MSEASLQRYFKREAAKHKVFWRKIQWVGHRGCPDVFVAYKGRVLLVELKNPNQKGQLSRQQDRMIRNLIDVGGEVQVAASKEEVDRVIRSLTQ